MAILYYNSRNFDAEPGDIMVDPYSPRWTWSDVVRSFATGSYPGWTTTEDADNEEFEEQPQRLSQDGRASVEIECPDCGRWFDSEKKCTCLTF